MQVIIHSQPKDNAPRVKEGDLIKCDSPTLQPKMFLVVKYPLAYDSKYGLVDLTADVPTLSAETSHFSNKLLESLTKVYEDVTIIDPLKNTIELSIKEENVEVVKGRK